LRYDKFPSHLYFYGIPNTKLPINKPFYRELSIVKRSIIKFTDLIEI